MSLYETVFIARQDVSPAQVDGFTETFEKIITDQGGTVPKKESWGLRTLAYKIKKNRKGYYVLLNIDAPSAAIQEMERQMHLNEDVIRYLTTRVDALEEGPSAIMKAKERGDDRGRRGDRDGGYKKFDKPGKPAGAPAAKAGEAAEAKSADSETPKKAKSADSETPKKEAAKDEAPEKKADVKVDGKAGEDKAKSAEDKKGEEK